MQLQSKPSGYISGFASHTDPAYSIPPPKLIEPKQEQTLLGANLKSFIKQRLFGNFINYTKLYNSRKYNFTPPISTLVDLSEGSGDCDPMKSSPAIRESYKHRINSLRTNMQKKIHERYNSEVERISEKPKNRVTIRSSMGSNLQQSTVLNSQRSKINKSSLSNKYSLHGSHDKNISYDFEKYPGSSFISAIEEPYQSKKANHSGRKERKLSPINNKAELLNKLEKVKNNLSNPSNQIRRSPNRLQTQRYEIVEGTWQLFCQPIKSRGTEKVQVITSNLHDYPNVNESVISTLQANKSALSVEKSKFSSSRAYFAKESFTQYLNNIRFTHPPLSSVFYNFFQIGSKLYDQLKIEQYKSLTEIFVTSSPRVWAISSFRFWDNNQDGIICSKDIFAIYQILDSQQNKLKQTANYENSRGYKIVIALKAILEDLRSTIIQVNFDFEVLKKRRETQNLGEDKFQMKYLEEALLRKKDLKYSDLILVLGQNMKNLTKDVKKSVIDTAKDISVKYSSCYRYSFLATDHNQQTREDREHIQNLKEQLKKERMQFVERSHTDGLEKDKILGIDYKTYYEKQLFSHIKAIVLEMFGVQLV